MYHHIGEHIEFIPVMKGKKLAENQLHTLSTAFHHSMSWNIVWSTEPVKNKWAHGPVPTHGIPLRLYVTAGIADR